ncbi:GDYXXLXY domain-containing protein [bacterium]|nr:GDYXXLXY domain-containing protein [bacterium]
MDHSWRRRLQRYDRVFVVLQENEPYWKPISIHREKPAINPNHVSIKGTVRYVLQGSWNPETQRLDSTRTTVHIRYGIENYFVPEGKGQELERLPEGNRVDLVVA